MKPTPARQRRQAHRRRLALGRALHQVRAMRWPYRKTWGMWQRGRALQPPAKIKLPRAVRKHRMTLYRAMVNGGNWD